MEAITKISGPKQKSDAVFVIPACLNKLQGETLRLEYTEIVSDLKKEYEHVIDPYNFCYEYLGNVSLCRKECLKLLEICDKAVVPYRFMLMPDAVFFIDLCRDLSIPIVYYTEKPKRVDDFPKYFRLAFVGAAGVGKSTLCKKINSKYNIPVYGTGSFLKQRMLGMILRSSKRWGYSYYEWDEAGLIDIKREYKEEIRNMLISFSDMNFMYVHKEMVNNMPDKFVDDRVFTSFEASCFHDLFKGAVICYLKSKFAPESKREKEYIKEMMKHGYIDIVYTPKYNQHVKKIQIDDDTVNTIIEQAIKIAQKRQDRVSEFITIVSAM